MSKFAIQIIGPAGAEWFLDDSGRRVSYEERATFETRVQAALALGKFMDTLREQRFLVNTVNTEDGPDEEPMFLGEMACAF